MTKLRTKQVVAANCHCKEPSVYKVGDKVFLLTRNIKTEQLLKKLNYKNIGPFKIKKLVGLLYQLELPYTIKIHDVFHPNLLWKAANNPLLCQQNSPPPPTIVNDKKNGKLTIFWMLSMVEVAKRCYSEWNGRDMMTIRLDTVLPTLTTPKTL